MNMVFRAFTDPAHESQQAFRAVMSAMAQPGQIVDVDVGFAPPAPLNAAAAAVLLTLADYETKVWSDTGVDVTAAQFLRFHTGARLIDDPALADFAVITDTHNAPALSTFAPGTPDYPDRSATAIIQVKEFQHEWRLTGPGIEGETRFSAGPLPEDFIKQWRDNHARFPQGVDIIFAGNGQIAALPRSTEIVETG
ncbi:phosphonate C-P lyase system protein PhnH [Dichotomicrobium thermohalophilum]|uniref:Alpha-D-ribose 1-methylphosphonate 5-triphosphate synthase subunit PhnH n=1 Tax=Dichotomicrobium thermohalophilum TaxID=933063 RepID=A0A397QBZ2_9HYPH|nr:phosphonate C-P lyase system protein PhnH [Dichotomicrobium thermohalophilum]RIA55614.1 alpha-D-ribose 1-methylphosphonate 5-triphosphate synthase subunit PhnH [Dichotomicrobium thermohalophilum]